MGQKVDLAGSVLDSLVLNGTVQHWTRHLIASTGRPRPILADVYDVAIGPRMSETDEEALRGLLESHGRTSLSHQLELRFRRLP
jgi:hypothetical protein